MGQTGSNEQPCLEGRLILSVHALGNFIGSLLLPTAGFKVIWELCTIEAYFNLDMIALFKTTFCRCSVLLAECSGLQTLFWFQRESPALESKAVEEMTLWVYEPPF